MKGAVRGPAGGGGPPASGSLRPGQPERFTLALNGAGGGMKAAMALARARRSRPRRGEHERSESVETSRMKIVYAACERGGRPCLSRIGVAFIDADGVLNVKLEALPVSGELRIVDYAPARGALGATAARASQREPNARA
jgi:hypothetical protein